MTAKAFAPSARAVSAPRLDVVAPLTARETFRGAAFLFAHIPLAFLMRTFTWVSTLHAVVALFVGLLVAASSRKLSNIAIAVGYISGAEVLWRMTKAGVFWEYGKYATCAVILVGLLRVRGLRNRGLALGYFVLLLPSALLTLILVDLDEARQQISFNLSGPLTVSLCAIFFSNIRLGQAELRRVFVATIAPILAIATLAYLSTVSFELIEFTNRSNAKTTAGFGPNQVAAMFGLGVLLAILLLFERKLSWRARGPLMVIAIVLSVQAALTFSRGGLLLAGAGVAVAMIYLMRERRTRITIIAISLVLLVVGKFVVEPRLEAFTGGALGQRFSNTATTGRDKFIVMDMKIFASHPLVGVGPGMADPIREQMGFFAISHTEFSRMPAEHGILGIGSLILLVVLAVRVIRDARDVRSRAFVAAMLTWVAIFMAIYAMRLAAPGFIFGIACAISNTSRSARK